MRKTKIICTIGPASESEDKLKELMLAGMNVARFNFSHGSHDEHRRKFERIRKLRDELDIPVATMLDTKGPEIRLKDFKNGKEMLEAGQTFTLTARDIEGTKDEVSITYKDLTKDCKSGMTILLDDGLIELCVEKVTDTTTGAKEWFELTAKTGEACCKFGCLPDYEWVPERTPIDDVYTFSEWVQGFTATLERR